MAALKFVPREGVWDLMRAYAGLTDWHGSTSLLLAGDGPLKPELEAYVRQQRIPNIIFTGWVPYSRLIELYALSDLFVHPAIEERWGCSVNEALACRLPVVVSDLVGASYDLVKPGVNGYTYRGGDTDALRAALATSLEHREEWAQMGEQSVAIVQDWDHDRCIEELHRTVDYILSQR
jgi:glycosyltransferase involved in cell wall biosynthesis